MRLRPRTLRTLRLVVTATLLSAAFGAVAGFAQADGGAAFGTMLGTICGLVLSLCEIALRIGFAAPLRRLPMPVLFAVRAAVYGAVMTGSVILASILAFDERWERALTVRTALTSISIAVLMNVIFIMRALLGGRALAMLLTGRYHTPRREERIVLFLDLLGSTGLTKHLGDQAFYRFLNRAFRHVGEEVLEAGGEIYRYVGDGIIVVWPIREGLRDGACIGCLMAIDGAIARRRDAYLREFGAVPRFRGALHAGPMMVGEMGDVKREIVLLGDTMNTASRIEGVARSTGNAYVVSAAVMGLVPALPPGVRVTSLGTVPLRGRAGDMELFTLTKTEEYKAS